MVHESGATESAYSTAHEIANVLSRSTEFTENHDLAVDRRDGSVNFTMWPADDEVAITALVNADGVLTDLASRRLDGGEFENLRGGDLWEDIVAEGIPVEE